MKEENILESFKQYHNANWHDGDNTFDERTYAKSNGDATSSDISFDDPFVQYCFEHYEAGYHSGYEKAYDEKQKEVDKMLDKIEEVLNILESTPYWDRSGNCEPAILVLKSLQK